MKNIFVFMLIFFNINLIAFAECSQLEAQVIANVGSVMSMTTSTCTVALDFSAKYSQLNSSYVCPLDIDEVGNGVTLQKINGNCPVKVGDFLSGILYRPLADSNELIYLE